MNLFYRYRVKFLGGIMGNFDKVNFKLEEYKKIDEYTK